MAYINIDVDLDEVSTADLLEELSNRYVHHRDLIRFVSSQAGEDILKMEIFLRAKDRYSVRELESLLKESLPPAIVSPNQLRLAI